MLQRGNLGEFSPQCRNNGPGASPPKRWKNTLFKGRKRCSHKMWYFWPGRHVIARRAALPKIWARLKNLLRKGRMDSDLGSLFERSEPNLFVCLKCRQRFCHVFNHKLERPVRHRKQPVGRPAQITQR